MIIDKINKTAFIHVPKCGGTSLRNYLKNGDQFINVTEVTAHSNCDKFLSIIKNNNVDKFICVLRNPLDWFFSYFHHSCRHGINREYVDKGFNLFIRNHIDLYMNYYKNQTYMYEYVMYLDLVDLKESIKKLGYGNMNQIENKTENKRIISFEDADYIKSYYNGMFFENYKCTMTIKNKLNDDIKRTEQTRPIRISKVS